VLSSCKGDSLSSITRPEHTGNECNNCRGSGEHHYHDKDGCHTVCEWCNGTGKIVPLSEDQWI